MTLHTITRSMQVSALLLFLLGIYMAFYMSTVQSPVLWPAYGEYVESLEALKTQVADGGNNSATAAQMTDVLTKFGAYEAHSQSRGDARYGHAHANLQALWVFAAALALARIAVPIWLAGTCGFAFIIGTWTHSGFFSLRQLGVPGLTPIMRLELAEKILLLAIAALLVAVVWDWVNKRTNHSAIGEVISPEE